MKTFWTISGLVAAALAVSAVLVVAHDAFTDPASPEAQQAAQQAAQDLPWRIATQADGSSRVMGLALAEPGQGSTLADAHARWGDKMTVAVIAASNEVGSLEAFVDPMQAGFIGGKLVITAQATPEQIDAAIRPLMPVSA